MRSSYAGSSGGVGGALVGSARLVLRGCSPAPPLRRAATPAGGALRVHDPPAGPLARAPCARWPTSRPSAVVDVRCRLARGLVGCAVPNVSCGRLFSGCALGLGLAPVTSLSRSLRLTARASRPLCSGGVAPSATYLCSVKASAYHTLFCMVPSGLAFKSFTRRATIEKKSSYLNQCFI